MLVLVKTPELFELFDTTADDLASMMRYWYSFDNAISERYANALEQLPSIIFTTGYSMLVQSYLKSGHKVSTYGFSDVSEMISELSTLTEPHFITDLHHTDSTFRVKLAPVRDAVLTTEMNSKIRTLLIDEFLKTI